MSDKKQLNDKCAVTRDLMPLCIDGTASEASQRKVDKHVADCDPCATVYQEMQTSIDLDVPDQQETEQFDTAVKKVKHKHAWRRLRNVLLGIVLALVVCAGLAYGYYWYFVEEVPLPVDLYEMELALHTGSTGNTPVIIKTENMPRPAKLHIEVQADGTVMDDDQQMRPNWQIYIWATTTRATDLDTCGYANFNYYGFDQVEAKDTWYIKGEVLQASAIYKGAPDAEQTLLYKPTFKESMKWTTTDYVLHGVTSIEIRAGGQSQGWDWPWVDSEFHGPYVTAPIDSEPMPTYMKPTTTPRVTKEPMAVKPTSIPMVTRAPIAD